MLIVVRHGEARPAEQDPARGLSEEGSRQAAAVARALRALRLEPAAVWHSGKLRAEQTARVLADALGAGERVQPHAGLEPGSPAARTAAEIAEIAETDEEDRTLIVVGHLPHLGRLLSLLLAGREEPDLFRLPPAGAVGLERAEGGWQVQWFLTPATCAGEPLL